MSRVKVILLYVIALFYIGNSYAQNNPEACKANYKIAQKDLNEYYITNQDSFVLKSLKAAEIAVSCKETKIASISIKLKDLIILKRYREGIYFADSLKGQDFKPAYKKILYFDYIIALNAEAKSDTANRDHYLNQIIAAIADYLNTEKNLPGMVDEDAYTDIFFIELKLESIQKICEQIEKLKLRYPAEKKFWDSLKSTLIQAPNEHRIIN